MKDYIKIFDLKHLSLYLLNLFIFITFSSIFFQNSNQISIVGIFFLCKIIFDIIVHPRIQDKLSPLIIVIAYYLINYILPLISSSGVNCTINDTFLAIVFTATTQTLIFIFSHLFYVRKEINPIKFKQEKVYFLHPTYALLINFVFLVFTWTLYLNATGGLSEFIATTGRNFLEREGAGIQTIIFKYTFYLFSFVLGSYLSIYKKSKLGWTILLLSLPMLLFLGGKSSVAIPMIVFYLSFLNFQSKIKFKEIVLLVSILMFAFIVVTLMRNFYFLQGGYNFADFLNYSFSYFTTLQNMCDLIDKYNPGDIFSIFLPFNKLASPIGFDGQHYDLSSYLTSIFYPYLWDLRTTTQWPIEADLYLSFGYFISSPLILLTCLPSFIFYRNWIKKSNIKYALVSILTSFYLTSHLKSAIFLWTDFYFYPFMFLYLYLIPRMFPADFLEVKELDSKSLIE